MMLGRLLRAFPIPIALALLTAFGWLGWELRSEAPALTTLESVNLGVPANGLVLGYRELAQHPGAGSAAARHLELRDSADGWTMANLSTDRRVDAPTENSRTRHLKRWPLQAGARIQVGTTEIQVERADADGLALTAGDRNASWQDGQLDPGAPIWIACPGDPNPLRRWLSPWVPADKEVRLFSIGGQVDCAGRWSIPDLPSQGLWVLSHQGRFWLAPGQLDQEVRLFTPQGSETAFSHLQLLLDGPEGRVERVILGRTHYRVRPLDPGLAFDVLTGGDVWYPERPEDREQLAAATTAAAEKSLELKMAERSWMGAGLSAWPWGLAHWHWLAAALASGALGVLGVMIAKGWLPYHERLVARRWLLQWPLPLMGITLTVGLWRSGDGDLSLLMIMAMAAWSAATLVLMGRGRLSGRAGLLWCGLLFLCGTGGLTLTQLAVGADHTGWLRGAILNWLVLTGAGWLAYWVAWLPGEQIRRLFIEATVGGGVGRVLLRLLVLIVVAALLVLQVPLGSEHGLFGVQPVEAGKLALVLVLAFIGMHVEELGFVGTPDYREAPLSLLRDLVILLMGVMLLLIIPLVGVRDLSPVLLMMILLFAWTLHITPGLTPTYRWLVRILAFAAIGGAVWGGYLIFVDPDSLPAPLAAVVPEDRFRVWSQPWRFPHSGAQLLQALDLGSAGGLFGVGETWTGWNGWQLAGWNPLHWTIGAFGKVGWFGINGSVMTLPEVDNDFIATFFIHRFGLIAGMVLLGVQILLLMLLFNISHQVRAWGLQGNRDERQAARVLALTVVGFAWLLAGHWLIAWGNILGVLPVMGQPMTLLAAANSHLMLFAVPGSFIALGCAWMLSDEGAAGNHA